MNGSSGTRPAPERRRRVGAQRLIGEVDGGWKQGRQRKPLRSHGPDCRRPKEKRREIADRDSERRARAEPERRRFDPDQRVVLHILDRVERVVADDPGDAAEPQQKRRPVEALRHRRPADQRPPREDDPEPGLRPPGDALHERVSRDRRDAGNRDQRGDAV